MIRWLTHASLSARHVVLAVAVTIVALAALQFDRMPVDALPEFAPPTVEVQTEAIGLSAEEVESLITIGLEELLSGVPWLESTRSSSVTGLSTITLVFKRGTDIVKARQMVQERLVLDYKLPNVATPPVILQPVSTTNRFMLVAISSDTIDATELSLLARWTIKPRLIGVPGVANVSIWGQRLRQLHVQINPERLRDARVVQDEIIAAAGDALWVSPLSFLKSSAPSPGGWFDNPSQRIGVEHSMPIESPEDMAKVTVTPEPELRFGRALPLGDVAELTYSHQPVIGDATVNGGKGLLLVLEKFPGTSVADVTRGVDQALTELTRGLPGVKVDASVYRLATYVDSSVSNVRNAVLAGVVLAFVVVLLAMRSWGRACVVAAATIVSLAIAIGLLEVLDATVNALMLAGLALAVAVVADAAAAQLASMRVLVIPGLIALLAIVPLLALRGTAGAFVQPYALAYALVLAASMFVAATLTPALTAMLDAGAGAGAGPGADADASANVRHPSRLTGVDERLSRWTHAASTRPGVSLGIVAVLGVAGLAAWLALGQARVPALDGTTLVVEWSGVPGTSQIEMQRITARAAGELQGIEGVKSVAAHIGRAVTGDRVVGVNDAELWIGLDPAANTRATRERVTEALSGYPGIKQTIDGYLDRKLADVFARDAHPVVVRVYGPKRDVRLQKAAEIRDVLAGITGVVEPRVEGESEEPQVQVRVDLDAASRADVKPGDVRRASATVFSGIVVGYLFKEQKIFEVVVWGAPEARTSLANLRDVWIDKADRTRVRLSEVAQISMESTPTVIRHERIAPYVDVVAGLSGASLSDVHATIEGKLKSIQFPLEHRPEVVGEAPAKSRDRLRAIGIAIAAAIGILLLLEAFLGGFRAAAAGFVTLLPAVGAAIVVAAIAGGVSMASGLGLLVVIAVAARHVLTMLDAMQAIEPVGGRADPASTLGAARSAGGSIVVGTIVVVAMLLPAIVLGSRPGLELVAPMAIVVVAGAIVSALCTIVLLPSFYLAWRPATAPAHDAVASPVM